MTVPVPDSPLWNILLLCRQYVNLSFFEKFGLKHFVAAGLLTENHIGELKKLLVFLANRGLAIPHPIQDNFFRLRPMWWQTLGLKGNLSSISQAWANTFLTYYDNYANGLDRKLESPEAEAQLIGRHWVALELENLFHTHQLALTNRRCIHSYYALCNYFALENKEYQLYSLAQITLQALDNPTQPHDATGLDVPYMKANALNHIGNWHLQNHEFETARDYFQQIIEVFEPLNRQYDYLKQYGEWIYDGQTHAGIAWMDIGNTWLRENQFNATEEAYLKAVEYFEDFPNLHRLASALNMLGTAYSQHRYFDKSRETFAQALAYAQEQSEPDENQIARILHNSALNEMEMKAWDMAEKQLQEALSCFRQYDDKQSVGLVFQSLGNLYAELGRSVEAQKAWKQSLQIFITLQDDFNTAISYQNLGNNAGELLKNEEAIEYLKRAAGIFQRIGQRSYLGQALHNLGMLAFKTGAYVEALQFLDSAEKCYRDTNNGFYLAQVLETQGLTAIRTGNPAKAKIHYTEAVELFWQHNAPQHRTQARRLLAEACFLLKEYENAASWLQEVVDDHNDMNQPENNIEPLTTLGRILVFLRRDEEAISKFAAAQQLALRFEDHKAVEEIRNLLQSGFIEPFDKEMLENMGIVL